MPSDSPGALRETNSTKTKYALRVEKADVLFLVPSPPGMAKRALFDLQVCGEKEIRGRINEPDRYAWLVSSRSLGLPPPERWMLVRAYYLPTDSPRSRNKWSKHQSQERDEERRGPRKGYKGEIRRGPTLGNTSEWYSLIGGNHTPSHGVET